MNNTTVLQDYSLETSPRRVLLLNPSVHDTRFPWSQWQQPVTLLQLASALQGTWDDVCLQLETDILERLISDSDAEIARTVMDREDAHHDYLQAHPDNH